MAWHGRAIGGGLRLAVATPDDPMRPELEAFVAEAFQREHGARVRTYLPTLIGCRGTDLRLRGVVGLRGASEGPLFLERYLPRPAHEVIGEMTGGDVSRNGIAEVGNLAGCRCRAAIRLVAALPQLMLAMRYEWIVFTATRVVRGMLDSLGAPLFELAPATAASVRGGADDWGRYYETDPRVYAGYLPTARRLHMFRPTAQE